MQELLIGLEVEHDIEGFVRGVRKAAGGQPGIEQLIDALRAEYLPVTHPLVRVHPDTGRRLLFLGGTDMRGVKGVTEAESQALIRFLGHHIEDPRFHCRWRWTAGDLAIWDERSTNHRSAGDHFPQPRSIRPSKSGAADPSASRRRTTRSAVPATSDNDLVVRALWMSSAISDMC
jgi:taurine dioxygenase